MRAYDRKDLLLDDLWERDELEIQREVELQQWLWLAAFCQV